MHTLMRVIDSHAHLTHPKLAADRDVIVRRAAEAGVRGVVTVASSTDDAREAIELASGVSGLWATAGIHPHEAAGAPADAIDVVRALIGHPSVVAVGETGLDYHYDLAPRDRQRALFADHLELAAETGLPAVVHARDADADVAAMIREAGTATRGVLHCFAGGRDLLETALSTGWYISFTGLVTFKSWGGAELLRAVPADRVMVETDSPYMAPVPHRGKRNEPAFVTEVLKACAAIRGEAAEDFAERCLQNTRDFFALPAEFLPGSEGSDA